MCLLCSLEIIERDANTHCMVIAQVVNIFNKWLIKISNAQLDKCCVVCNCATRKLWEMAAFLRINADLCFMIYRLLRNAPNDKKSATSIGASHSLRFRIKTMVTFQRADGGDMKGQQQKKWRGRDFGHIPALICVCLCIGHIFQGAFVQFVGLFAPANNSVSRRWWP